MDVAFSGLPGGTFPTHLHSRCDGRQSFHITILGNLAVAADGDGAISVPTDYFGRGLCVIVYTDTSLTRVLAYRSI